MIINRHQGESLAVGGRAMITPVPYRFGERSIVRCGEQFIQIHMQPVHISVDKVTK